MNVRFTTIIGMPVTDDQTEDDIGTISDILIQPDTAQVEGFFVSVSSLFHQQTLFLSVMDVLHVGTRVRVRHADVLAPLEDLIRLQSLLEDGRTMLNQLMITESGRRLGRCLDVQFETQTFLIGWFFPKKWFRWQVPVPRSAIVEVRPDEVIVRDLVLPDTPIRSAKAVFQTLDPLGGTTVSRVKGNEEWRMEL
jgi:uncharacterized protein YrrD